MVTLDNLDISSVLGRVYSATGVDFGLYRESTLRRRISRRMVASRCDDLQAYLDRLDAEPAEMGLLRRDLTIKWTEFFRDPEVFRFLRDDVIPAVIAHRAGSREPVTAWSAGCATGEEPYSLAASFALMNMLDDWGCRADVLATDIDHAAIEFAKRGAYTKRLLPRSPEDFSKESFRDDGGVLRAREALKARVEFAVHDLTSACAGASLDAIRPGRFDLILCRNVLVYLQRPAQARVLELCCSRLRPGGYLVLGTREMAPSAMHDRLAPYNLSMRIYRRLE